MVHKRISFIAALLTPCVGAQVTVSIDHGSPTISLPDSAWGVPITEGDLLQPFNVGALPSTTGPLPTPGIRTSAGFGPPLPGLALPSHATCVGHPPGLFPGCAIEVDALSFGTDFNLDPAVPYMPGANLLFTVDNFAVGMPGFLLPDLSLEAFAADAAADIFGDVSLLPVPMPPFAVPPANVAIFDGDGIPSVNGFTYPAIGLLEPSPPAPPPTPGDDIDALDVHTPLSFNAPVYFSLEGVFPDPLSGAPASASAATIGFAGGDVLVNNLPGAPPALWAAAPLLGLDLVGGPRTDDLDALIIWDNGDGVFTPSRTPFDWAFGTGTDMVLFSVRRGSAIIGTPDSLLGLPIEAGDILTTPPGPGALPGILFAAENFGLVTRRSSGVAFGDELNGADTSGSPILDCDLSGVEDAVDIAFGYTPDVNMDGVPDPCQLIVRPNGFGSNCPCGNDYPFGGCLNSTGAGGILMASGSSVYARDDLVLQATQVPPNGFGLFFMGTQAVSAPFGDGFINAGGTIQRHAIVAADPFGVTTFGPGIIANSLTFPPSGMILPGQTWNFQLWFRDIPGVCGGFFNTTNALQVTFIP